MTLFKTIAVISCLATPVFAKTATYTCDLNVSQTNGWVPEHIVIKHDSGTNDVIVNDSLIQSFIGKPIAGKVDSQSDKRVSFVWKVAFVRNTAAQVAKFGYRATYFKKGNIVSVTATPFGFNNHFEARGTCAVS